MLSSKPIAISIAKDFLVGNKNKNSTTTFRNKGLVQFMVNLGIEFGEVVEEHILFILFAASNGERKYRRHVGIMPH